MPREVVALVALLSALSVSCQPPAAAPTPPAAPPVLPDPPSMPAGGPIVTAVAPAAWPSTGGVPLWVSGESFLPGARITLGGAPTEAPVVLSPAQLRLPLPPRPGAFGPVPLVVTNPDGKESPASFLFSYSATALDLPLRTYAAGYKPRGVAIADPCTN